MNVALWVVAIVLAVVFLGAGLIKLVTPKAKLLENPAMGWAASFPQPAIKAIAAAEIAGAVGLILPGALGIAPWLVPTAATGLALTMVGAVIAHGRRGEWSAAALNVALLVAAGFVAALRFGSYPL